MRSGVQSTSLPFHNTSTIHTWQPNTVLTPHTSTASKHRQTDMTLPANTLNIIRRTQKFEQVYDFYVHTLGLSVISLSNQPGHRGALLSLSAQMANATVEILTMDYRSLPDTAPLYVEFSIFVEDATELHDRLNSGGTPIASALEDTAWGVRTFGVDDPDGIRIWFRQYID